MIFTTGLLFYHTSLIINNLTTKEELKNIYKTPFGNPFLRSINVNINLILFPKLSSPSLQERMQENYHKQKSQAVNIKDVFNLNL